jgi:hypothetical protein
MKAIFNKVIKLLNIRKEELFIFLPFLPVIAFKDLYKLAYIPFLIILFLRAYRIYKKRDTVTETVLGLALYTVILPDNYTVIFVSGILFLVFIYEIIKNKRYRDLKKLSAFNIFMIAFCSIFLLLNIVLNKVSIISIFLFGVYNFTFIAMLIIYSFSEFDYKKEIDRTFNTIIVLQLIYIVIFIPLRFNRIIVDLIGDWSVGTLGVSEGPILFNIFIFGFMKYLHQFIETKDKYFIALLALSFLGAVSTVSVSLTLIFIMSLVVYVFIFIKGFKYKGLLLGSAIILFAVFWGVSHPWIREQVKLTVTDSEFRKERVKKIKHYDDTFVMLPSQDIKFLLIGNGMGHYSSRAALTASGYYVSWYSTGRELIISKYTKKYIKPQIFSQSGISLTETPTSQYISVMGEFGLIGLGLFLLIFGGLILKQKGIIRLTIIYFLCIFIVDNWTEYPKVVLVFESVLFYMKTIKVFPS